jgi:hypothetical protein
VAKEVDALGAQAKNIPKNDRKTALYDAIEAGISMFGQHRAGDTICLITDGADNSSRYTRKEVEQSLLAKGIRTYAILLLHPHESRSDTPEEAAGCERVREVTMHSGGTVYVLQSRGSYPFRGWRSKPLLEEANALSWEVDQQLVNAYVIKTRVPSGLSMSQEWNLEVVRHNGKVNHHASVFYLRLSPCQMTP